MKAAPMQMRSATRTAERKAREFAATDPLVKFTIRIPESMRVQLKTIAAREGTNVQSLIVEALRGAHGELE